MFVYKWKVSDIIKGTALVKQIGNCTVTDDEGKRWLVKVLSQSLFTQSVGIITSKLNLLFWNALQNVVFKLHSDGLPDLSLNLNKLHFSFLCKVWTVVKNMLLNWIIIPSWAALFLIYLMFSNKEKKKLVLKQIILSIGLAVWLGRCQVAPTTGSE